jgi:hypothetical protein
LFANKSLLKRLLAADLEQIKSRRSSAVEHFLGKEEVMGSSPIVGSALYLKIKQ